MHTYIHTYIHTCMHACMHACMHTYIHTYTYIYIYIYKHILPDLCREMLEQGACGALPFLCARLAPQTFLLLRTRPSTSHFATAVEQHECLSTAVKDQPATMNILRARERETENASSFQVSQFQAARVKHGVHNQKSPEAQTFSSRALAALALT